MVFNLFFGSVAGKGGLNVMPVIGTGCSVGVWQVHVCLSSPSRAAATLLISHYYQGSISCHRVAGEDFCSSSHLLFTSKFLPDSG